MDFVNHVKRWVQKGSITPKKSEIEAYFDCFIAQFIAYNALYNECNDSMRLGVNSKNDKEKATTVITKLGINCLLRDDDKYISHINCLATELENNPQYYIVKNNHSRDMEIRSNLRDGDLSIRVSASIETLYNIRCNLFHGDKAISYHQKSILFHCIELMKIINNHLLSKYTSRC